MTVAVLCAVVTAGIAVRREFFPPNPMQVVKREPVKVQNWEEIISKGHRMGPANAAVTLVEFGDFECPACRKFTLTSMRAIRNQYPNDVALVFRHWPLPYHKSARIAALASECAGAQGRFEAMHDLFYRKQDSLATKSIQAFATEAGVTDLPAFGRCMIASDFDSVIASDTAAALQLKGRGTPMILLNGMNLNLVPDSAMLAKLVEEALRRK